MTGDRVQHFPESRHADAPTRLAFELPWSRSDQSSVNAQPEQEARLLRTLATQSVRSELGRKGYSETEVEHLSRQAAQWRQADDAFLNLRIHTQKMFGREDEAYRKAVNFELDKQFRESGGPHMVLDKDGLHVSIGDLDEFRPDGSASRFHVPMGGGSDFDEFGPLVPIKSTPKFSARQVREPQDLDLSKPILG